MDSVSRAIYFKMRQAHVLGGDYLSALTTNDPEILRTVQKKRAKWLSHDCPERQSAACTP